MHFMHEVQAWLHNYQPDSVFHPPDVKIHPFEIPATHRRNVLTIQSLCILGGFGNSEEEL